MKARKAHIRDPRTRNKTVCGLLREPWQSYTVESLINMLQHPQQYGLKPEDICRRCAEAAGVATEEEDCHALVN